MDKAEFDKIFVEQLPQLNEVIPKLISKYNKRHLEVDLVINETYLYCYNLIDHFNTKAKLISYIAKFINSNIYWTNSKLNKMEAIATIEFIDFIDFQTNENDEQELDIKIMLEDYHNNTIYILSLYREFLVKNNKKVQLIVFDTIFQHNIYTGSKLSKQLKINKDASCKYLRELKQDIKAFSNNIYLSNKIR